MDVSKILAELRAERALLDEVIGNLERMAGAKPKRGRPRKYPAPAENFPASASEPPASAPSDEARAARTA